MTLSIRILNSLRVLACSSKSRPSYLKTLSTTWITLIASHPRSTYTSVRTERCNMLMRSFSVSINFLSLRRMTAATEMASAAPTCRSAIICKTSYVADNDRVSETAVHLQDRLIILTVSLVPWRSVFDTMTFDFGMSDDDYVARKHRELRPRQAAATSAASSSTSISYPAAPTASTPTGVNVTYSFNPAYIDTAIFPPDTSLSITGTGKA